MGTNSRGVVTARASGATTVATVQGPSSSGGRVIHLAAGTRITFGSCCCSGCAFDVVVDVPGPVSFAGAVTAHDDHWRLDNLSGSTGLACHDMEDESQSVRLAARRLNVTIPFELSRVLPEPRASEWLTVFGPEPTFGAPRRPECAEEADPVSPLNRGAAYFAVLEALCRPRITDGPSVHLPSSALIADKLNQRGMRLTRRAVDHHIDYLVERLGLALVDGAHGRFWKREALATAAVQLNLLGDDGGSALGTAR